MVRLTKEERKHVNHMLEIVERDDFEISPDARVLSGEEARIFADELLEKGRPRKGSRLFKGPRPKRQVRLNRELDEKAQNFITKHHMTFSELLRAATAEYLATHA